jgi:hypothetical protein
MLLELLAVFVRGAWTVSDDVGCDSRCIKKPILKAKPLVARLKASPDTNPLSLHEM